MQLPINQKQIEVFCDKQDISYLGLFGSQVRGDARQDSDIDVLIDFPQTKSFFELARVQEALENIFNKKVDLVLRTKIKPLLREHILNDLIMLYEKR